MCQLIKNAFNKIFSLCRNTDGENILSKPKFEFQTSPAFSDGFNKGYLIDIDGKMYPATGEGLKKVCHDNNVKVDYNYGCSIDCYGPHTITKMTDVLEDITKKQIEEKKLTFDKDFLETHIEEYEDLHLPAFQYELQIKDNKYPNYMPLRYSQENENSLEKTNNYISDFGNYGYTCNNQYICYPHSIEGLYNLTQDYELDDFDRFNLWDSFHRSKTSITPIEVEDITNIIKNIMESYPHEDPKSFHHSNINQYYSDSILTSDNNEFYLTSDNNEFYFLY